MALPTLDKTYQYNVNQNAASLGVILDNGRQLMRMIKNSLIGFGTLPWTVRYSCDGTTAGSAGDTVDRWAADANLVWSGTTHSWIVLRQTGIATNFELCIDLANANSYVTTFVVSPSAGFTGGTTSARPTATDQIVLPETDWGHYASTTATYKLHVLQSTDGQVTHVVVFSNNLLTGHWMFQKPKNPVSGWTNPSVSLVTGVTGSVASPSSDAYTFDNFLPGTTSFRGRGTGTMTIFLAAEGTSTALTAASSVFAAPNDFSGEYPFFTCSVNSTTASHRGRHGLLFDTWLGLDITNNGDTYPNDTSRQFLQIATQIIPWNGSVAQIS